MANKKKPRLKRKKVASYSITTQVLEDFNERCEIDGCIPSNKVEELITNFINNTNKV